MVFAVCITGARNNFSKFALSRTQTIMEHPLEQCRINQKEFLETCPESLRGFHAVTFRIGNATYVYHQLAYDTSDEILRTYYEEWLEGLPPGIKEDMKTKGFERGKNALPFTRYVNERNDIGMNEWMQAHLSAEDYAVYKQRQQSYKDSIEADTEETPES